MALSKEDLSFYQSSENVSPDTLAPAPERILYALPDPIEDDAWSQVEIPVRPGMVYRRAGGYSREDILLFAKQHEELYRGQLPDPTASLSYTAPGVRGRTFPAGEEVSLEEISETFLVSESMRLMKTHRISTGRTAVHALMEECGVIPGQSLYNKSSIKHS